MTRPSRDQLLMTAWLVVTWLLLWGSIRPVVLISAVVVAPLCLAASLLPALPMRSHPRWYRVPLAMSRFMRDLLTSSAQVAWTSIRRGGRSRSAIIAVHVPTPTDVALTMVANRLSLEPGTLVVDIDRETNMLYLYRLDVQSEEDLAAVRCAAEARAHDVLAAVGEAPADRDQDRSRMDGS